MKCINTDKTTLPLAPKASENKPEQKSYHTTKSKTITYAIRAHYNEIYDVSIGVLCSTVDPFSPSSNTFTIFSSGTNGRNWAT